MTRPDEDVVRLRQRERSRLTGWLLGAFVILVFAITITKMSMNW